jgi:predicted enzyme related to lactoylglutathione lyase
MSRVVHFEIPVKDYESAKEFYSNVFDWKITKWEGPPEYYMVSTGDVGAPGIDGGFYQPEGELQGTINTIDVQNLDETLAKVQMNGGQVIVPKGPVPGVGWLAYARDNSGNIFGMMQTDPKAGM